MKQKKMQSTVVWGKDLCVSLYWPLIGNNGLILLIIFQCILHIKTCKRKEKFKVHSNLANPEFT